MKAIYYILLVLNLIAMLFVMVKNKKTIVPIFVLVTLVVISEAISDNFKSHRFIVYHIYIILEILLLSSYYYLLYKNSRYKKAIVIILIAYAIALGIHYYSNPAAFGIANYFDFVANSIAIILFVFLYFMEELNNDVIQTFYTQPSFYINVGNLFFYGGCMLVMGFKYLVAKTNPALAHSLLYFNYGLNLLLYTLYLIGFLCLAKTTKQLS